ncbi:MAG: hypothetical protein CMI04_13630 [Oceanospirillaceae bacterium]|nr:hypothetical protein [Oceanospirillaceae bacterium]
MLVKQNRNFLPKKIMHMQAHALMMQGKTLKKSAFQSRRKFPQVLIQKLKHMHAHARTCTHMGKGNWKGKGKGIHNNYNNTRIDFLKTSSPTSSSPKCRKTGIPTKRLFAELR